MSILQHLRLGDDPLRLDNEQITCQKLSLILISWKEFSSPKKAFFIPMQLSAGMRHASGPREPCAVEDLSVAAKLVMVCGIKNSMKIMGPYYSQRTVNAENYNRTLR